jgi:hypothetical protein
MEINIIAVLVCGVAAMIVGFLWYGPLFGKAFMRVMCTEKLTPEQMKIEQKKMGGRYFIQFIIALITAAVLSIHISHWSGNESAMAIAVCTWFGFVVTTEAGAALWSGKSNKLSWYMFLVTSGAQLVTFIVFAIILSAWQ